MITQAWSRLEIKSFDDEKRQFEGIASTPNTDRQDDIVNPLGAKYKLPLAMMWQHGKGEIKDPVGWITHADATKDGIRVRGQIAIPKDDYPKPLRDQLDGVWVKVRDKIVRGLSVGFKPIEAEPIKGSFGTYFKAWEWLELSAVGIAANADASIQTIKSLDAPFLRAASGNADKGGNSDPSKAGVAARLSKGSKMKTLGQMQEDRAVIAARMKELNDGCSGDFSGLTEDERTEFDDLTGKLSSLDVEIKRTKAVLVAVTGATEISSDPDPEKASRARRGVTLKDPPKDKGIGFAQYVKMIGRAKGNPMHALAMAQNTQGVDSRVINVLKTAVSAGSVGGSATAGNWGMELVGAETSVFADFVDFLRPMTILGKFGANGIPALRRVPFRVPLIGMTTDGTGYWVGEGKAKPLTKFGFSRTTLEPLKVAVITAITNELLADSSPAADGMIRDQMAAVLRKLLDQSFIDPGFTGQSGVSPDSITKNVSFNNSAGNDAAGVREDLRVIFAAFIAANNAPTSGVWIMSATSALGLSLMVNTLGQPEFPGVTMNGGTLFGLPVITSEYVPTVTAGSYVFLVNAQDIYYGDDGEIRVDTSEHASLQMDDGGLTDGMHDSTTPTAVELVSMFQTNSTAFRAERRVDWMLRRPSAVQGVDQVNWGVAGT